MTCARPGPETQRPDVMSGHTLALEGIVLSPNRKETKIAARCFTLMKEALRLRKRPGGEP